MPNTGKPSTRRDIHRRAGACCRYSWRTATPSTKPITSSSGANWLSPVDKSITHWVNAGNAAPMPENMLSNFGITSSNKIADTPSPVSNSSSG
ncbi:hypothetical protein D3C80_1570460 [compost metagenome]